MKKMIFLAVLCFVLMMSSCGDKPGDVQADPAEKPGTTQQNDKNEDQKEQGDPADSQKTDGKTDATDGKQDGTGAEKPSGGTNGNQNTDDTPEPEQPAEETSLDRKIIMLLREQMSGQFDTGKMEFRFDRVEVVEGAQCRVYSMMMPGNTDPDAIVYFAVLADQSVIYQYDVTTKKFVQVYSVR